jgi:hypothetical protein
VKPKISKNNGEGKRILRRSRGEEEEDSKRIEQAW